MKIVSTKYKPGQRSPNLAHCWRTSSPVRSSRDGNVDMIRQRLQRSRYVILDVVTRAPVNRIGLVLIGHWFLSNRSGREHYFEAGRIWLILS
jgi:hypothetical protein